MFSSISGRLIRYASRLSAADVVGFLHADDLFADDSVLAKIAEAFASPSADAVYGDLVYFPIHFLTTMRRFI
jgi:hypothetical protein